MTYPDDPHWKSESVWSCWPHATMSMSVYVYVCECVHLGVSGVLVKYTKIDLTPKAKDSGTCFQFTASLSISLSCFCFISCACYSVFPLAICRLIFVVILKPMSQYIHIQLHTFFRPVVQRNRGKREFPLPCTVSLSLCLEFSLCLWLAATNATRHVVNVLQRKLSCIF